MTAIADQVAGFIARDPYVSSLGISLVEAHEDRLSLGMEIRAEHTSFLGACHGGVIFTLADTAFGMAANAAGSIAVGIDTHTAYIRGVQEGDRLVATAEEVSRSRKTAVYRVDVRRENEVVTTFTGTVYLTDRPLPDED